MTKTILIVLIAVVVAAAAGLGGYRMGDSAGFERANAVRQEFFQQRQTAAGQGQLGSLGSGGGQGRGAGVSGVIKSVDGDTMTVTLGNRDVKVGLTDKTQILKATPGARSELAVGARVMITADATGGNSDALNASAIQILPPQ